jgi:hypothetical protein
MLTTRCAYRVIDELRGRFAHFMKTGDDSNIPANLLSTTYVTVSTVSFP